MSSEVTNVLVGAATGGSVYALVGTGFVLVYRATSVISFAQGGFALFGAFTFWTLTSSAGLSLFPAIAVCVAASALLGIAMYLLLFARVITADVFTISVATLAAFEIMQGISQLIWGSDERTLGPLIDLNAIQLPGGIIITRLTILTVGMALGLFLLLVIRFRTTRFGLQMRAVADSPRVSIDLGVSARTVATASWALAAAAAAVAGILFSMNSLVSPANIPELGIVALPAILLGGLGSVAGALVGGLVISLVQSAATVWFGGSWSTVAPYLVLFVVLLVRPQGIFGHAEAERA